MAIFVHAKIFIKRRTHLSLISKRDSFADNQKRLITLQQVFKDSGDDYFLSDHVNQDSKILAAERRDIFAEPDFRSFERIDKEEGIGLVKTFEEDWDESMMPGKQEMGVEPLHHYRFLALLNMAL